MNFLTKIWNFKFIFIGCLNPFNNKNVKICEIVHGHFIVCISSGAHNRIPKTGWLKWRIYFFTVLEHRSPRSMGWQGLFLVRPLFLVCRWLPSCCVLTCTFLFLCEHLSYWIRAPLLWLHLTLMTFFEDLSPNTVTIGVKASTYEFLVETIPFITLSHINFFFSVYFSVINLMKYAEFINHRYQHLIFGIGMQDKFWNSVSYTLP